jgi:hypothetical protein
MILSQRTHHGGVKYCYNGIGQLVVQAMREIKKVDHVPSIPQGPYELTHSPAAARGPIGAKKFGECGESVTRGTLVIRISEVLLTRALRR